MRDYGRDSDEETERQIEERVSQKLTREFLQMQKHKEQAFMSEIKKQRSLNQLKQQALQSQIIQQPQTPSPGKRVHLVRTTSIIIIPTVELLVEIFFPEFPVW